MSAAHTYPPPTFPTRVNAHARNYLPSLLTPATSSPFPPQVRQLGRIDLSWSGLVDIEYEPDIHEGADGIGFIRGPVYIYEMY